MKNLVLVFSLIVLMSACKKDELSDAASLIDYSVTDISRPSFNLDRIYTDDPGRTISLLFSHQIPVDSLPVDITATFSLPAGAKSVPASGETITLNSMDQGVKYTITAEDGSMVEYYVALRDNQIPNSDFEDWFTASGMNGVPYQEPGKSAGTTVWATANNGTSIYGVYGTLPVADGDNTIVQITTGETVMVPVTSGTIFTGKFDMDGAINNPMDPTKATLFGIPFSLRPDAMRFKYAYQPGTRYIKATPNNPTNIFGGFTVTEVEGEDKCAAYAILEKRDGTNVLVVGRAEFYSGELQDVLTEVTVPFIYTSSEKPTHISVVFASSTDGAHFTGSVGSVLSIDDLELIYEDLR